MSCNKQKVSFLVMCVKSSLVCFELSKTSSETFNFTNCVCSYQRKSIIVSGAAVDPDSVS